MSFVGRGLCGLAMSFHIESEVLEVRPSKSRSNQGLIKVRTTTLNQNDEAVQVQIANLIVPRQQSADA